MPANIEITKDTTLEEVSAALYPLRSINGLTFLFPTVLVSREGGNLTLRNGGNVQAEHEIEEWLTFEQTKDYPMGVQRTSPLIFGGRTLQVLDDKSVPTAFDYMEHVGKRTLWSFSSTELPLNENNLTAIFGRPIWKNRRVWVTIPEEI